MSLRVFFFSRFIPVFLPRFWLKFLSEFVVKWNLARNSGNTWEKLRNFGINLRIILGGNILEIPTEPWKPSREIPERTTSDILPGIICKRIPENCRKEFSGISQKSWETLLECYLVEPWKWFLKKRINLQKGNLWKKFWFSRRNTTKNSCRNPRRNSGRNPCNIRNTGRDNKKKLGRNSANPEKFGWNWVESWKKLLKKIRKINSGKLP